MTPRNQAEQDAGKGGRGMKEYLVTEYDEDRGAGDNCWETTVELPLNGRWLTREDVAKLLEQACYTGWCCIPRLLGETFGEEV